MHLQRHSEFGSHLGRDCYVARIGRDIAHACGFAGERDPACDTLAERELKLVRLFGQTERRMDFQPMRGRIDENDRTAVAASKFDRFAYDQLERLLRIERGMQHIADAIKLRQPFKACP